MRLFVEYDVAAAIQLAMPPGSLMPSCRICPALSSVVHDLVLVDRRVLLPRGVVDADLAEQALHAEGARLIDEDRHDARPERLVAQQLRQETHVGLRGADLAPFGSRPQHCLEGVERGHGEVLVGLLAAVRQVAAERLAALVQVAHLGRVVGRLVERDVGELVVRDRHVEAVAEGAHVLVDQLLGLVRRVLALAALAHAETCLLYTSPNPRDRPRYRIPSSA